MGVRTRTLDMQTAMRRATADRAKREEAVRVVERWNKAIAAGRDVWWPPTIRAAIVAGMPWADVYCPGCLTSRSIDLRAIDRHPLASVGSLVLGLRARGAAAPGRCRRSRDCAQCRRLRIHRIASMPGKRVQLDDETWRALDLLAHDSMKTFQELSDEAFADLLKKHRRPVDLKSALRESVRLAEQPAQARNPAGANRAAQGSPQPKGRADHASEVRGRRPGFKRGRS